MVTPEITYHNCDAEADARFIPLTGARLQRLERASRRACGVPLAFRTVSSVRTFFRNRAVLMALAVALVVTAPPVLEADSITSFDSTAPPKSTGATVHHFTATA